MTLQTEYQAETDTRPVVLADEPTHVAAAPGTQMRVRKRDGSLEPVNLDKIVKAISRCAVGLDGVDIMRVATRTISGLVDEATFDRVVIPEHMLGR